MSAAWVIVEQDEGLMTNTTRGGDVEVFEVDYDEAKREGGKHSYARSKIAECALSDLPQDHKDRIIDILEGYLP